MQRIPQLDWWEDLALSLALCHSSEKEDLIIVSTPEWRLPVKGRWC